jgi:hypothetical protein
VRTNVAVAKQVDHLITHEGALAGRTNAVGQLRRSVMSCMLYEGEFYEDGVAIADRIAAAVKAVPFADAAAIAIEARERFKLRHVPLHITVQLIIQRHQGRQVGDLIAQVIQRPDEMGELCAMYWKGQPDKPITKQMKVGLARALRKFNEYSLAKNDRDGAVRIRDVLFLSHARPKGAEGRYTRTERKAKVDHSPNDAEALYARIASDTMATPETWEVLLSASGSTGRSKKDVWEQVIDTWITE